MHVSKLCRSCMKETKKRNVKFSGKTINMYQFCTGIEVTINDDLPKHICYDCTIKLKSAYTFIKQSHRVNSALQNRIKHVENDEENENLKLSIIANKEDISPQIKVETRNCENPKFEEDKLFRDDDEMCLSQMKREKECSRIDITKPTVSKADINDEIVVTIKTECESSYTNVELSLTSIENTQTDCDKKQLHVTDTIKTSELDHNKKTHSEQDDNGNLKCSKCEKVFTRRGWYERHIKCVHKSLAPSRKEITEEITSANNQREIKFKETDFSDSILEIPCKFCGKKFTSYGLRNKHLNEDHTSRTPDGKKTYLCSHCPKTFTTIHRIYYHITRCHGDTTSYRCKHCEHTCRARYEMRCHEWREHGIGRRVTCDQCDRQFSSKSMLVVHMRSHDGAKPYLCNVCGRGFSILSNLSAHMRTHSAEKQHVCAQCPFRCASAIGMRRHERRHAGERKLQCTHCPKRFYDTGELVVHIRRHTGEKPYRCPYCSQTFVDTSKRRRHFVSKHKMVASEIPPMTKNGDPIPSDVTPHWKHFNKVAS